MLATQPQSRLLYQRQTSTPLQNLLGVLIIAALLVGWKFWLNAANWFAPFFALVGLLAWLLAGLELFKGGRFILLRNILQVVAWWGMLLAIVGSLSLGVFLPTGVAEWGAPVLGKFGGGWALGLLAVGTAGAVLAGYVREKRSAWLDFSLACGLAALWTHFEVARQVNFPAAPTNSALWLDRLNWLLVAVALFFAVGLLLTLLALHKPIPSLGPAEPASIPPAFKFKIDNQAVSVFCLRWSTLLTVFGLAVSVGLQYIKGLESGGQLWYFFALFIGLDLGVLVWGRKGIGGFAWGAVWLFFALLAMVATYASVTEDLEVVLLRNSAERQTQQFWRKIFTDDRFAVKTTGSLSGQVRAADGKPLEEAQVVVATVSGQTFSAKTDADGVYVISNVPEGNYLPLAVRAGYQQNGASGRVATVLPGKTAQNINFQLSPVPPLQLQANNSLVITLTGSVTRDNPELSTALRSTFSFENLGSRWDNGLIHEPPPEMGNGPFPILFIVYPGPTTAWEGVSIPLAAKGFVVVSYFPNRLLDLAGDLDDLRQLMSMAFAGQFSKRSDPQRVAFVGGSVSTVYVYLMAQEMAASPLRENFKAAVNYGGLFDMFRFRQNWEEGQVVIDPGISELEYLLIAFGRPDTRPELYLRFSPRYRIDAKTLPPTMLVHVNKDIIVPVEQSIIADKELSLLKIPHELTLYPELEHYLDMSKRDPAYADMLYKTLSFLHETLR